MQRRKRVNMYDLKLNHYYVAEVELFKGNMRHRIIFRYRGKHYDENYVTFYGYENPLKKAIEDLYYFNVISEIEDMSVSVY